MIEIESLIGFISIAILLIWLVDKGTHPDENETQPPPETPRPSRVEWREAA